MARKISHPPRATKTIIGYADHPTNRIPKAGSKSSSSSTACIPAKMNAPPKIYSLPRRTYRSRVMTAVTVMQIPAITGSAKGRNQVPPEICWISSRYSAAAAKSQGTKMTGFGL